MHIRKRYCTGLCAMILVVVTFVAVAGPLFVSTMFLSPRAHLAARY